MVVARSYFGEDSDEDDAATWTIGDVVSALGVAGLSTVLIDECPESDRFATPLDSLAVPAETRWRVPGALVLAAIKL